jgi:hypothetical protein
VVEGARLESVYTLITYRGFESLSLRHFKIPQMAFLDYEEPLNPAPRGVSRFWPSSKKTAKTQKWRL